MTAQPAGGPLVSIVLPTHNGARYLRQSIESCLGQTHRNLELIVVDDASSDETPEIVRNCAGADPRVVAIRNERNLKLPASLNVGFARARGDFLTWTSDDNYYDPRAIERMLAFLRERGADFVYCDYYLLTGDRPDEPQLVNTPEAQDFSTENRVGGCFLYSRRVRQEVGDYDENLFLVEDYDYWIRVAGKFPMRRLPEPLYCYRRHRDSLSLRLRPDPESGIARSLLRLKHHLAEPRGEAEWLARDAAQARAEAPRGPVAGAALQAVRIASLGILTPYRLYRLAGRLFRDRRIRRLLQGCARGEVAPGTARAELKVLLERGGGPGR